MGDDKVTPLEYLCSVYRDKDLPLQMRFGAAMSVAPYMHPRLEAVDVKVAQTEKPWWQDEGAAARARAALRAVDLGWDDEPRPSPPVIEHKPASAGAEPSVSAEPGTSTEVEANKEAPPRPVMRGLLSEKAAPSRARARNPAADHRVIGCFNVSETL